MPLIAPLVIAAALATTAAPDPPCPGETTADVNLCFSQRLAKADAALHRYLAAARDRLRADAASAQPGDTSYVRARQGFETAELAWPKYVDAECGAVRDYWSAGTIRDVEDLDCRIRVTRLHTHTIWRLWLTYMDSTPPILPEPPVPAED